jgi:hypothetical protein
MGRGPARPANPRLEPTWRPLYGAGAGKRLSADRRAARSQAVGWFRAIGTHQAIHRSRRTGNDCSQDYSSMNDSREVRNVLQRFQDGYSQRDMAALDEFMALFVPGDDTELIGIGATAPNENEWFRGAEKIREIIESDWKHWGDVNLDVKNAKITVKDDVAWLSTRGGIGQTEHIHSDEVTESALEQMKRILEDKALDPRAKLVEAAHCGVRRWREREKPAGYEWPFVFTAILLRREGRWRFHTIHWSMPVD